ncbi:hypothetical protein [Streptomyces sp. NBC_01217]|uniref:hypothetical protein n=1 Tax=Streptomyces sp. NBC_01217 TaxID=2903779 RepID=UPI002E157700|nr:hypothetical protein OG507_00140 [Streptomyces sp. NBC_01217]WSQ62577.1 hypothetical protein OG507_39430 [Streptomyces sp. NBC_01217]
MPSVLGLMERREARARQELESWTEVLEQAQAEVDAARERVERARVGREELVSVLAEESPVSAPVSVSSGGKTAVAVGSSGLGAGQGGRPPVWRSGMGEEVLSGLYREVFAAVVAASGPVNGVELTRAVGREAEIKNEVEKIRHRANVLEKRGWLVRAKDGRFIPVPELGAAGRGVSPASAERPRPSGQIGWTPNSCLCWSM